MKMFINSFIIVYVMLLLSHPCFAQSDLSGPGIIPFQVISNDARTDAMGQAGLGLVDSTFANPLNPAELAFLRNHRITFMPSGWLPQGARWPDYTFDHLLIASFFEGLHGTLSADISYLNFEYFDVNALATALDLGVPKDQLALTVGYSPRIWNNLGLGLNLRYVNIKGPLFPAQQVVHGVSSTFSFDISALWCSDSIQLPILGDLEDRLSIGFALRNIGPKITYIDVAQAQPALTNIGAGIAYDVLKSDLHNASFVFDLNRILLTGYETSSSAGIEYWYGNPKLIALRIGYLNNTPESLQNFLTLGGGIRYGVFGFDLSVDSADNEFDDVRDKYEGTISFQW